MRTPMLFSAVALLAAAASAQERPRVTPVEVINFPEVLTVKGEVSLAGTIRRTSLVSLADVLVAPVKREDTTRLVDAGVIPTDGFAQGVATLIGELKGPQGKPGEVGAILLPDEERVLRALAERGQLLLATEVKVTAIPAGAAYFAAEPLPFTVAYPRYRVLLYNAGEKTVSLTLHAYLTE